MKTLIKFLPLTIVFVFSSCNPKVISNLVKNYPPLDYKQDVIVFGIAAVTPADAELLGVVKIGDTGFSTNCSYATVLDKAKLEARKVGGNAIKITEHKLPSAMSTCHRITAQVLRLNKFSNSTMEIREVENPNLDYAILNIYRYGGVGTLVNYDLHLGDSVICRVNNNFKATLRIKKDGLNSLWARTETKTEIPIDVKFGKVYYLRCGVIMGTLVGRPVLELVESEIGWEEFQSIKSKK